MIVGGSPQAGPNAAGPLSFWPLFDLVVRTPRLELRLPREDEFPALLAVIEDGVHDPATMPFTTPFTDTPSPARERESAQWWGRQRAEWSADKWNFTGAVFVDGQVVGVQDMTAQHFAALRSVQTGSQRCFLRQRALARHLPLSRLPDERGVSGPSPGCRGSHGEPAHRPGNLGGAPAGRHRDHRSRPLPGHVHRPALERQGGVNVLTPHGSQSGRRRGPATVLHRDRSR
jgi:hypothetical protein